MHGAERVSERAASRLVQLGARAWSRAKRGKRKAPVSKDAHAVPFGQASYLNRSHHKHSELQLSCRLSHPDRRPLPRARRQFLYFPLHPCYPRPPSRPRPPAHRTRRRINIECCDLAPPHAGGGLGEAANKASQHFGCAERRIKRAGADTNYARWVTSVVMSKWKA